MKLPLSILLFGVLALGALSAGADPMFFEVADDDLDPTGSWAQRFTLNRFPLPPAPGAVLIQGRIADHPDGTEHSHPDYWELPAIDTFNSPTFPTGWARTFISGDSQYFVAEGTATTSSNGSFMLHGTYDSNHPEEPPATTFVWLQAYSAAGELLANGVFKWKHGTLRFQNAIDSAPLWTQATPLTNPIPEPFSMAFLGCAFMGVVGVRLRSRRKEGRS